jgi:hypothetical protein
MAGVRTAVDFFWKEIEIGYHYHYGGCSMRCLSLKLPGLTAIFFAAAIMGGPQDVRAEYETEVLIKDHRFVPDRIEVPRDTKIRLRVINKDKTAEEFESFDLNREKIIAPGGTVTIFLPKLKPGEYEFFGEFNPKTARGYIVVK